jgi:D-sedoheptulose 7-phosphate isomerase
MKISNTVEALVKKIKEANYVFICGNGGSAATAEHLTEDLFSKGIRAICLNSNTPLITMIANDFSFDKVFSDQLEVLAQEGDILITISCSGTSKNIVNAQATAYDLGLDFFEFEVFGKDRNYEALEDRHMQFCHQLKKLL